jgi:hypothetical protein
MLRYRTGEEIKAGDCIRFHGNAAAIELVADPETDDPEAAWYIKEFGGGVLIADPSVSGHTFIHKESLSDYEDLEFVARLKLATHD